MSARPVLLAIDDEPGMLAVVERLARNLGFVVVSRTDARAALAELTALKPDAVLVDLRMPEINGLDVLREIRAVDSTCPPWRGRRWPR
jgi:CheY-like chemotaxis protein